MIVHPQTIPCGCGDGACTGRRLSDQTRGQAVEAVRAALDTYPAQLAEDTVAAYESRITA